MKQVFWCIVFFMVCLVGLIFAARAGLFKVDFSHEEAITERRVAGSPIFYFQDPRTNVCYSFDPMAVHGSNTAVDCTDLVLKAVDEDRKWLKK